METMRERILRRLDEMGTSARQAAIAAGESPDLFNNILRNRSKAPRGDTLAKAAKCLGVTVDWLTTGTDKPAPLPNVRPAPDLPPPPSRAEMPQVVPVRGTGAGSDDGAIAMETEPLDYIRRPPGIANARDVYALFVEGDSMSPRYEPGDPIYVSSALTPKPGDHVVIQCRLDNGDQDQPIVAFVKKLAVKRGNIMEFWQHNPAGVFVPPGRVISVHRVFEWRDLVLG